MRSVHSWSLHAIEDTWNFWTRSMVIYFVRLYVTKCFKRLIRGLVLMIYFACLCITKRCKRVIRGLDLVTLFWSGCYWCVSPTVWKFGLKLIVRIKKLSSFHRHLLQSKCLTLWTSSMTVSMCHNFIDHDCWNHRETSKVCSNKCFFFVWVTLYYNEFNLICFGGIRDS